MRTACFLDDHLGIEFGYSESETSSKFVLNTLINASYVTNKEKSVWEPTKFINWLGTPVNLKKGCLYVSEERISDILGTMEYIIFRIFQHELLQNLRLKLFLLNLCEETSLSLKQDLFINVKNLESLGTKRLISKQLQ